MRRVAWVSLVSLVLAALTSACGTNAATPTTTPSSHRVPVSGGTASTTAVPAPLNRPDLVKALGCEFAPWGKGPVFAGKTQEEALQAVGQEYFLPQFPGASGVRTALWEGDPPAEEAAMPAAGWYLLFAVPGGQGLGMAHVWKSSAGTYMATPGPDCMRR